MFKGKYFLLIIAIVLGLLITFQVKSFAGISGFFEREGQSNIFQEIKILKDKNQDLLGEVESLESTLEQLADQNSALKAIEAEIIKYKKLSGKYPIFGPGVSIVINSEITTPWVVDLVNEFFNSGAEAVSINGIRITNHSAGFDTIPNGNIFINGSTLSSPYTFNVIGESSTIIDILELPGGIFDRLEANFPDVVIETEGKEIIQME